jgi:dethiobiotin synthetase
MSPLGDSEYVADLARDFAFPLIVVTRNVLGTINATLQTLITASVVRGGLPVAGLVLNHPAPPAADDDVSLATNRAELAARSSAPLLASVACGATGFDRDVDWRGLAKSPGRKGVRGG